MTAPGGIASLGALDALLVDLGGVLVDVRMRPFLRRLAEIAGPGLRADPDVVFAEETYHRFARGELDGPGFHAALVERYALAWPYDDFARSWSEVFEEIPASIAAIERMASRRPVYVLSNTDELHWGQVCRRWEWPRLLSGAHLSFEQGVEKPDARFYRGFLQRHGLRAERCLFVDDREENVVAAREVGLAAVRQTDPETLGRTVDALLEAG